jgi:transcription antitermination factor NusG
MSIEQPEWYALVVRPRNEKAVAQALDNRNVEQYLPVYRGRYRSAGRLQDVDLPLFPQYVFCRMGPHSRAHVLSTPGVFRFVMLGNSPARVNDSELARVRRAVTSGMNLQPWPFLEVGDMVEIAEGPFRGLTGRLLKAKGEFRLILNISLLQRSVALTIDRGCVKPSRIAPVSVLAHSGYTVVVA